ncbi:sigma-70 family RNA polymerase sigma factor [Synechococcales cyanobacterium C]|uniref:Sigma-70 family RNA polymerase sigma factor n=1 Tax=Petrachloros mirabilis ULC683 TaxID=2781853 RepID=A0A8K2A936_9CYAN|nr:sigma-70 family RNA polymerase sigma factor [Petrachloros mirabilis]NCJ08689.1 sigma-70 family RNA polymerase sigma factor [Petrachloros mirabilis ULC683]
MPQDPAPDNLDLNVGQATDAVLIEALRQGHVEALGALYDRYAHLVYRVALKVLTQPDEAEEVTQDIFVTLWQRDTYNPSRGTLQAFLSVMARSRAMDRLRSKGTRWRMLQRLQRHPGSPATSPLETASLHERSREVKTALTDLPHPERIVLELAYFEGLSQSQIAQRLDIPLGTVKSRTRQGLQKLRQVLSDHR